MSRPGPENDVHGGALRPGGAQVTKTMMKLLLKYVSQLTSSWYCLAESNEASDGRQDKSRHPSPGRLSGTGKPAHYSVRR